MLSKYEEAQGLTEEMVSEYMTAAGWIDRSGYWIKGGDRVITLSAEMPYLVDGLARVTGRTAQSILRDMNPRLRPWPSAAAILAHDGIWIAVDENGNQSMVFFMSGKPVQISVNGAEILTCDLTGWRFWPCDLAGNKIPWPEKDGVML